MNLPSVANCDWQPLLGAGSVLRKKAGNSQPRASQSKGSCRPSETRQTAGQHLACLSTTKQVFWSTTAPLPSVTCCCLLLLLAGQKCQCFKHYLHPSEVAAQNNFLKTNANK